jgi:hypothetical protein
MRSRNSIRGQETIPTTKPAIVVGERRYYKGIYPVEVVLAGGRKHRVKSLGKFLLTSSYSTETRWMFPGDLMTVPARLLWSHQRKHNGAEH